MKIIQIITYYNNFFQCWNISTSDGAGVFYEPYCGKDTRIEDFGLGEPPNVVLSLVKKAGLVPGSDLFFDNLFTRFVFK